MNFNEYLQNSLEKDDELRQAFDELQPEYEIISTLIRARIESGLTQKELAEKCGLKQSNISRLESGKANPTIRLLKRIADSLDSDLVIHFQKKNPAITSVVETTERVISVVNVVGVPQFESKKTIDKTFTERNTTLDLLVSGL